MVNEKNFQKNSTSFFYYESCELAIRLSNVGRRELHASGITELVLRVKGSASVVGKTLLGLAKRLARLPCLSAILRRAKSTAAVGGLTCSCTCARSLGVCTHLRPASNPRRARNQSNDREARERAERAFNNITLPAPRIEIGRKERRGCGKGRRRTRINADRARARCNV